MVFSLDDEEAEVSGEQSPKMPEYQGDTTLSLPFEPLAQLKPGTVLLDKFKIIDLLGQGGMGSVYRVEHLHLNKQFALKCLNKYQSEDASWRRFKNEAKAAHMLDHANLLKVYEFGLLPGGQPFFLMELVEGITLADEIERLGHLPIDRTIKIFIQVAFAIGYAHDSRVIHRDLKPSNIMLMEKKSQGDAEVVKVVDFGIAKLTGVDEFNQQTLTKTGEIFGSPLYMSPEQCMGIAVDHRSDLYSLGCVLYEALTSLPPFLGDTALSTMMKHQSEKQISLREASLGMQFPDGLESVVAKLLEKDPQDRYQSAGQLASDLIRVERSLSDTGTQSITGSKLEAPAKAKKREVIRQKVAGQSNVEKYAAMTGIAALTFLMGAGVSYLLVKTTALAPVDMVSADSSNHRDISVADQAYEKKLAESQYWSTAKVDKVVFSFPLAASLGRIMSANGESYEAKGVVSLPREFALGMVANENLIRQPNLLDKFKPGELAVFDFNAAKVVNPAIFEKVGTMSELKGLNLYDVEFFNRDLHVLSKLKKLVYLNLGFTGVTCEEALKYIPLRSLNSLDLTCVKGAKSVIKMIPEMPRLRHLLLVGARVHDDDVKEIANTDRLRILDLAWNPVSDKGVEYLTKLKNLEALDLSETDVSPQVWKQLARIQNLHKVKIAQCKSAAWPPNVRRWFEDQMSKHVPNCSVNWVYENNLDYIVASSDLTWLGDGMRAHACPILNVLKDGSMAETTFNAPKRSEE